MFKGTHCTSGLTKGKKRKSDEEVCILQMKQWYPDGGQTLSRSILITKTNYRYTQMIFINP